MKTLHPGVRHHLLLLLAIFAICLVTPAIAVQRSLAGVIDWHKPLIGVPRPDMQPVVVDTPNGSAVYIATKSNVLALLDAESGNIAWRLQFDEYVGTILSFSVHDQGVLLISGGDAPAARLLAKDTGHLLWQTPLNIGVTVQPESPPPMVKAHDADFVVLVHPVLIRLDGETGDIKWKYDALQTGLNGVIFQFATTGRTIHLIAQLNSFAGYSLGHVALDITTGLSTSSNDVLAIDSSISSPSSVVITTNTTSQTAQLHWIDSTDDAIRSRTLSESDKQGPIVTAHRSNTVGGWAKRPIELKELGLGASGYFLAVNEDDSGDIVSARKGGGAVVIWHFEDESHMQRSPTNWNGYVNEAGQSFVTRLFWSHGLGLANLHIYNIDHPDGYVYTGKTFAFDDAENGVILNSAVTVTSSPPIIDNFTAIITTSTGAIQCWREQDQLWSRDEALADIKAVKMVELPERKSEEVKVLLEDEGVFGRAMRHVKELKSLPTFLGQFVARFAGGTYTKSVSSKPLRPGSLFRDQFGFQKLAVFATSTGKIFAIDSAHGNVVWTRLLGVSDSKESRLDVRDMWVVRDVSTLDDAVVAIIAVKQSDNGSSTVAYHLNAFTGAIIEPKANGGSINPVDGRHLFDGEPTQVFPLPIAHCKTAIRAVAVADKDGAVHLFPFCKKIEAAFGNMSQDIYFNSVDGTASVVRGYGVVPTSHGDGIFPGYPTYLTRLDPSHYVYQIAEPTPGPIASLGRVLGDRSALYKYLNPHLIAITTLHATEDKGAVVVLDSTSGRMVYHAAVVDLDRRKGLHVAMSENWLVYAWTEKGDVMLGRNGGRLVSVEMFENGKSRSSEVSSFSTDLDVQIVSKTFITQSEIKALQMTTSLQGITSKDVIMIDDRGRLTSMPRRLLDPRRPAGPMSKNDKEEMLIPYEAVLPTDPRRVISHEAELMGVKSIITSPALLESTSLVLAHGLDLFGTRVNPSGTFDILSDAFNKVQLVLTIAGLAVGILVAKPAVQRKMLRSRWY